MPNHGHTLAIQKWVASLAPGTVITIPDAASATGLTHTQAGGALSGLGIRAKSGVRRVEGSRGVYKTAEARTVRKAAPIPAPETAATIPPAKDGYAYVMLRMLHALSSTETLAIDEETAKVYKVVEI